MPLLPLWSLSYPPQPCQTRVDPSTILRNSFHLVSVLGSGYDVPYSVPQSQQPLFSQCVLLANIPQHRGARPAQSCSSSGLSLSPVQRDPAMLAESLLLSYQPAPRETLGVKRFRSKIVVSLMSFNLGMSSSCPSSANVRRPVSAPFIS